MAHICTVTYQPPLDVACLHIAQGLRLTAKCSPSTVPHSFGDYILNIHISLSVDTNVT